MIGCKVIRTLASVEFEIILILRLPCCLSSSSSVRCLENVGEIIAGSNDFYPVFVDPEISTQADGAQSPQVLVAFLEDPYETIRHDYLVETETPESPHTVASPTSLPDSTPPTLVPTLRRTARMAVLLRGFTIFVTAKCYRGTFELVEDDEEEEDEEIEKSLDSDSKSEDAKHEGHTTEYEDPDAGEEAPSAGDEGPGMRVESLSLGGDEADPYESIRQAYLVETEIPKSPHTVAPPTHHAEDSVDSETSCARSTPSDSTTPLSPNHPLTHASPTLVPILRRSARMVVPISPVMSLGLSTSIAEVAAMFDSAFRKRFRSSYESSPSSPPELPSWKQDEGPATEDEDLVIEDDGLTARDEGPSIRVESLSLGGDDAVPDGSAAGSPGCGHNHGQAYLVETETPKSPHTVAPPTHHAEDSVDSETSCARSTPSDSTTPLSPNHPLTHASPTMVPILRRSARMVVPISPVMSLGLSTSIAEVAAMFDSAFRKRFRSFYESSPSSPPELPSWKRYQGTSKLLEMSTLVFVDPEFSTQADGAQSPRLVPKTILLCLTKRTMCHGRLVFSDDELTEKELKQIEADDQAIQTILLGLPEDIYVAVDSCETTQEIWL
nr:hypothetical protein [Tanacetum cinerariifolium]